MGIAKHYETGESLPEDIYKKLLAARTYRAGSLSLRQVSKCYHHLVSVSTMALYFCDILAFMVELLDVCAFVVTLVILSNKKKEYSESMLYVPNLLIEEIYNLLAQQMEAGVSIYILLTDWFFS